MQTTTNYLLKKPDPNDAYNKQNDNDNMDTIDPQMKTNANAAAAAQAKADAAIPATEKAAANGVATLDIGGTIPDAQISAAITRDSELTAHQIAAVLDHPDGSVTNAKIATGIDATKIADGTVTSIEFQYINSLTSNAQTQLNAKAPLASPALTGTPTAPTAAVDTTTTQLATTAFVTNQASAVAPLMDGVATVGVSERYARQDHIHPDDTSKADVASPALTGTPTAPTAVAGTSTTQLATTAFVTTGLTTHVSDYVRQPGYGTTAGVANTYTLDLTPNLASYVAGVAVSVKINVTNTGASTLNVDGLGVIALKKADGTDFSAGDLLLDSVYSFRYNGVNFIYQSESGVIINGQTEEIILLGEAISKNDPVYVNLKVQSKLANPATIPTGWGNGVTFSPDGVYMVVGHDPTPFITIYKRSGDIFTKLANPATLPTGWGDSIAFSPDGVYMAVAHNTTPYITIYKRSGDVFTKLANPATLPTGTGYGVDFSPDGVYMAVAHDATPYITIYKRSGDVFTKLANPATLPNGTYSYGVAFSPDGVYMSVTASSIPSIIIYKRSGDVFTKLANPATLPPGAGYGVAFSQDDVYMAVAHDSTPYITIYKRSGDVFTKLANPATLPAEISYGIAFSQDDVYMAVAHDVTPYITIYKRSGDTFTKLANPAILPAGVGTSVAFSPDGVYMSVAHGTTPFVTIYKNIFEAFISDVGNWQTADKAGYAKESGLITESKTMVITHR